MPSSETSHETETWSLTARWLFPVDGPPLSGAVIVIDGDRIRNILPQGSLTADVDLGNAAIVPGFVNAHTHLDLSGLRDRCPPSTNFTGWLRNVIAHRRSRTLQQIETDIRAGLQESLRCGVTLLGDISAGGSSWPILEPAPIRAVVFYELLGLTENRALEAWNEAHEWLQAHPATATCTPGLSPHAPYSVRAALFEEVAKIQPAIPLAIHLAESREELQLLERQDGPFVDFLEELDVWDPQGLIADLDQVMQLYKNRKPLWIHGNYLDPLTPNLQNATIVYCPRTHARFQHAPHPFRDFVRRGINIAVGTDSLASNPSLDVLEEIRFLYRQTHDSRPIEPAHLLHMATLGGAGALGWEKEAGSLTPGKSADLAVVPLPNSDTTDPYALLLASPLSVDRVLFRGKWIPAAKTNSDET